MKIAIYGISRSGKDYFINDLIKYLQNKNKYFKHIEGSKELNILSLHTKNKKFTELNEKEKKIQRVKFIENISKYESEHKNIIVDGHYSFYENNKYNVVFTEDDLNCYDYFFYLDTCSEDVEKRLLDNGNRVLTIKEIDYWKNYEFDLMMEKLLLANKELHVIKYGEQAFEYINEVINGKYDSKKIAKELVTQLNELDKCKTVILTDCDKTISINDTTEHLMEMSNLNFDVLKEIYRGDRYSNYQAFLANKYFEKENLFSNYDKNILANNIELNNELIAEIESLNHYKIVAITASNSSIWKQLLRGRDIKWDVINNNGIMSIAIKYYVVKELQSIGKNVIALGDSMIDSYMLKAADKSYIISNKGFRKNIYDFLKQNTNIYQLKSNKYLYDNLISEEHISLVKTLNSSNDIINDLILICKSNSGKEGFELRKAHYYLGWKVGNLIKNNSNDREYLIIIMMRSGLLFGQGIADNLDCSIIFYNNDKDKVINKVNENLKLKHKRIIIIDGVINTGESINELVNILSSYDVVIASNVISSEYKTLDNVITYASRISENLFIGAKQSAISNGKGPDTSDRLFKTM